MLAIFTYIVVYNIVVLQGASIGVREYVVEVRAILGSVFLHSWRDVDICAGYKELGNVVGTTRMQLLRPFPQYRRPPADHLYCGNAAFPGPYSGRSFPQYPCRYLDSFDIVFPPVEADAMFVSTRITESNETIKGSDCRDFGKPKCEYETDSSDTYLIADLEFFTLLIDHTMSVPRLEISQAGNEMEGWLEDVNGKKVDACDAYKEEDWPCFDRVQIGKANGPDIITLKTLINAGGIDSLDEAAGVTPDLMNQTRRYAGVVLIVSIDYDNFFSYNSDRIQYKYSVDVVENAKYKGEEVVPAPAEDRRSRAIIDRHGLRIVVKQSGRVGRFNIQTLLVVLVTSLGLLAVSNSLVNFIAFNMMPMKNIYQQYRLVTSVDFSDVEGLPKRTITRFKTEDLINPRPAIFAEFENHTEGGATTAMAQASRQVEKAPRQKSQGGFFSRIGVDEAAEAQVNPLETVAIGVGNPAASEHLLQGGGVAATSRSDNRRAGNGFFGGIYEGDSVNSGGSEEWYSS